MRTRRPHDKEEEEEKEEEKKLSGKKYRKRKRSRQFCDWKDEEFLENGVEPGQSGLKRRQ